MSPWFWLGVFLLGMFVSVWAHEVAHVQAAKALGWSYHGWQMKWRYGGVQVRLESPTGDDFADGGQLWRIAAAGLGMTAWLAALFLLIDPLGPVFGTLFWFNLVLLVFNALPLPITDGGFILRGLTGWQVRWRHVLWLWILIEVGAVAYFVLS